jgi:hypothetical protein
MGCRFKTQNFGKIIKNVIKTTTAKLMKADCWNKERWNFPWCFVGNASRMGCCRDVQLCSLSSAIAAVSNVTCTNPAVVWRPIVSFLKEDAHSTYINYSCFPTWHVPPFLYFVRVTFKWRASWPLTWILQNGFFRVACHHAWIVVFVRNKVSAILM